MSIGLMVCSVFPGIGLLDRAFEEEGFCIVRGPDLLWGGDVRRFHPVPFVFDGMIGGPPCQHHTPLKHFKPEHVDRYGDMIPEFERCVYEAHPAWFLMENVRQAREPVVAGYQVQSVLLNNRHLGEAQNRVRRFSLGTLRESRRFVIETAALDHPEWKPTVTAAHGGERRTKASKQTGGRIHRYAVEEALELQGCPPDFFGPRSPFTREAQLRMIANGVPLPMGRAVARAVKRVVYPHLVEDVA